MTQRTGHRRLPGTRRARSRPAGGLAARERLAAPGRRLAMAAAAIVATALVLIVYPPVGRPDGAPAVRADDALAEATAAGPAASSSPRLAVPGDITVPGSVAALPWPSAGQAALAVGGIGRVGRAGPADRQVPIASVAKVMTAYVILQDHPLRATEAGPTLTVTDDEAAAYPAQRAARQSLVRVRAGERLTLRQALQALLIASADNVAQILARWDAGTPDAFVAKMNRTATRLGMTRTRYTDPSGLDRGTVSTAADQLILAERALDLPTLTGIAGQRTALIPVAGTIRNYNTLLGKDGISGLKTGSTTAAGGCLVFTARHVVGGRTVTLLGAVLGQPGTRTTILPNALAASAALVRGARDMIRQEVLVRAGDRVATATGPDGRVTTYTVADDVTAIAWPGSTFHLTVTTARDRTPRLEVRGPRNGTTTAVPLVARS